MALATQCPHCHTTFRVAQDQLKLRAGLVRCGNCKQIFNGVEHLLPPEGEPVSPPLATTTQDEEPPQVASAPAAPLPEEIRDTGQAPSPFPASEAFLPSDDPLQRMTLIDIAPRHADTMPEPAVDPAAPDPLAQTIEDLRRKPLRGSLRSSTDTENEADGIDIEDDEPEFVRRGRRKQRLGRALRLTMGIGSLILLLILLLQAAYVFRDQIATRLPALKPLLVRGCEPLGCQVGLPAQIEAISLEASELQALSPEKSTFAFSALLRNRGDIAQAWPAIELTLNDANEQPVARRVFLPRDYLKAEEVAAGLAASSERQIKLYLSLSIKASGYRAYLFHP